MNKFKSRRRSYEDSLRKTYWPEAALCLEDVIAAEEMLERLAKELRAAEIKAEANLELYSETKEYAKNLAKEVTRLQMELDNHKQEDKES